MKKKGIGILTAILVAAAGTTGVMAAGNGWHHTESTANGRAGVYCAQNLCRDTVCQYQDENGNGVCQYQDEDGDGICDYHGSDDCRGTRTDCPNGTGFAGNTGHHRNGHGCH